MAFVLGVLQVASSPGVKGFVGCPTSIAYFPEHKVVLCTIPKSSSSTWREFARRVQAVDSGTPSVDHWCGMMRNDCQGCLLDQSEAPPGVQDFDTLKRLVEQEHYTPAVFLRDPIERAESMWTGTGHAYGPDPSQTSFSQFVDQLEQGMYNGNQHMASQIKLCNFGRSLNESGIPWKIGASEPRGNAGSPETTRRAQSFVAELFGHKIAAATKHGWTPCKGCPTRADTCFEKDEFFAFDSHIFDRTSTSKSEDDIMTDALKKRIVALYPDDVETYEAASRQYAAEGWGALAPTQPKALVP